MSNKITIKCHVTEGQKSHLLLKKLSLRKNEYIGYYLIGNDLYAEHEPSKTYYIYERYHLFRRRKLLSINLKTDSWISVCIHNDRGMELAKELSDKDPREIHINSNYKDCD